MSNPGIYTVGWICAITTEYVAAQAFLDEEHEGPNFVSTNDNNDYALGKIGKHNVVIAVLPEGEYGTTSAASVARDMLHTFPKIRIGLIVGIGGGAPSSKDDIRLGDVVVSSTGRGKGGVLQYDFGKIIQGKKFETTGFLNQPPTVVLTAVSGLKAQYEGRGHQFKETIEQVFENRPRLRKKYGMPNRETDRLYRSSKVHPDDSKEDCSVLCGVEPSDLVSRPVRGEDIDNPAIHYGLIASANSLMKDAKIRDQLAQEEGVLCFEMEAAGLMNHFPCLIVRGICDYSDTHKNKDWQGYAAMVAAAYAKDLLIRINSNRIEAEKTLTEALSNLEEIADNHRSISQQQLEAAQTHKDIASKQFKSRNDLIRMEKLRRENECLQLFRLTKSEKDATYEYYKNRVEDRVEGTCTWVLEHGNFRTWLEKDTGPLLISADPGCGKSVLAKYLIDDVLPKTSTICYFFFKEQDQNTARQALCALLHQLFCKKPALIKHALDRLDRDGKGLIDSATSLWAVFNDVVQDDQAGSVIIVMDALDECAEPELKDMLQEVKRQCNKSQKDKGRLKFLLTSRPYEQTISPFRAPSDSSSSIRIPGEEESKTISREVNLVIGYRVERLAEEKGFSPEIKEQLAAQLLEISHRTYLWVYLVFDHLEKFNFKKTEQGIKTAMKTLPGNVNAAYSNILSKSEDAKMARKVLSIILAAERPLTLAEMNVAVNIETGAQQFDDIDLESEQDFLVSLRSWCGLFVSVYEGKVQFLHQTAKEFLLTEVITPAAQSTDLEWQQSIVLHKAQAELAELCMRFLSLFESSSVSGRGERLIANLSGVMQDFTQYAASYWSAHFRQAEFCSKHGDTFKLVSGLSDPASISYSVWSLIYCRHNYRYEKVPRFTSRLQVVSFMGLSTVAESLLPNRIDMESEDADKGFTPLLWAIDQGHNKVAEVLLCNGANANVQGHYGSALGKAAYHGQQALVELLLKHDATLNEIIARYGCALGAAASSYKETKGIVELMLNRGADIDAHVNEYGTTLGAAAYIGNKEVVHILLEKGADVNKQGGEYGTALGAAAYRGNKEVVQVLLEKGADVNNQSGKYGTVLGAAAYGGNKEVVHILLEKGVDVNKQGGEHGCALGAALANRDTLKVCQIVKLLLGHFADIDAQCGDYGTALGMASSSSSYGREAVIELLLHWGADVHKEGGNFTNAITAAAYGGRKEVIELLLGKGANFHAQGKFFANALAAAAYGGKAEIVELLLTRGADIHQRGGVYFNAIGAAVCGGKIEMVRLLLDKGAEVGLANLDGWTPLLLASNRGYTAIAELLLDKGAVQTTDKDGWTPLNLALSKGHVEVVKLLLEQGADSTVNNKFGRTPLHTASSQGHAEVVRLLLKRGDDPKLPDNNGWTPLHSASKAGHFDIVDMLLKDGTDHAYDKHGRTPLMRARENGHTRVVNLLLENGARATDVDLSG